MRRLLDLMAMSAGGWIGWVAGATISIFTAYVVSVIGSGLGLYASRRITKQLLP